MSGKYHKIQSIYKREGVELKNNSGKFMIGNYAIPEFELLKDIEWHWTEKVDGTNIRIIWDGAKIIIRGKSDKAQIPDFLRIRLDEIFQNEEMIDKLKEKFGENTLEDVIRYKRLEDINVCLYGEGYGARINTGGKYIKNNTDFVLFDIKIGNWWLKQEDVDKIGQILKLDVVPDVFKGTLDEAIDFVKKGFKSQWGNFQAEGIVGVPAIELRTRRGDRVIVKIKYNDLIKNYKQN